MEASIYYKRFGGKELHQTKIKLLLHSDFTRIWMEPIIRTVVLQQSFESCPSILF